MDMKLYLETLSLYEHIVSGSSSVHNPTNNLYQAPSSSNFSTSHQTHQPAANASGRLNLHGIRGVHGLNPDHIHARHQTSLSSPAAHDGSTSEEDENWKARVRQSLEHIGNALHLYGPDKISVAFNGGKDAAVVLHLYRLALAKYITDNSFEPDSVRINAVFLMNNQEEFPQIMEFVKFCEIKYSLNLTYQPGFVDGLQRYIQENQIDAFIMGTRRTDPDGKSLLIFHPSSKKYGRFMRVNPIIDWNYGDVWRFLRRLNLSYCQLYDLGYTSLGSKHDSLPNPMLLLPDGSFLPAYKLFHEKSERLGRERKPAVKPNDTVELKTPTSSDLDPTVHTVGMIIIGDEILSAKTKETNFALAAQMLRPAGISLRRVCMVPDDREEISREVQKQVRLFDRVITSGGVGGTHDDMTLAAIADAFGEILVLNETMQMIVLQYFGKESMKMASLPESASLIFSNGSDFPVIAVRNQVFALPGVPEFFEKGMQILVQRWSSPEKKFHCVKLYLQVDEKEIIVPLNAVVSQHEDVSIGCYPYFFREDCRTILTVESRSQTKCLECTETLRASLPSDCVINIEYGDDLLSAPSFEKSLEFSVKK